MTSIRDVSGSGAGRADAAAIECHGDVIGYFHERVVAAMKGRGVEAQPSTELYLVQLLSEAHGWKGPELGQTLVELYAKAAELSGRQRFLALKTLGDRALYVSGFFDGYLERRGLSRRYFAQMGREAYHGASRFAEQSDRSGDRARAPVFRELGGRFGVFAEVIDEVRESTSMRTDDEVLALYRRWTRTRSPTLAARLGRRGVWPSRTSAGPKH